MLLQKRKTTSSYTRLCPCPQPDSAKQAQGSRGATTWGGGLGIGARNLWGKNSCGNLDEFFERQKKAKRRTLWFTGEIVDLGPAGGGTHPVVLELHADEDHGDAHGAGADVLRRQLRDVRHPLRQHRGRDVVPAARPSRGPRGDPNLPPTHDATGGVQPMSWTTARPATHGML